MGEEYPYNESPHSSVGIVLKHFEGRDQVLVVRSRKGSYPVRYKFPGGNAKSDESPVDTLCREFPEETGLTPISWRLVKRQDKDENHSQFFYSVVVGDEDLKNLRQDDLQDGDDFLYPPDWLSIGEAYVLLKDNHRKALDVLIRQLESFQDNRS